MTKAILVDMDGTLALMGDRSPFDDHLAGADVPNVPVMVTVKALLVADIDLHLVVVSGRDAGRSHDVTLDWLDRHGLVPDLLLMRGAKDFRKDAVVKRDLFDTHVLGAYDVLAVFDDRQQVVDMWRSLGLTVFQVAPGDF
jgi:hypothetical protein